MKRVERGCNTHPYHGFELQRFEKGDIEDAGLAGSADAIFDLAWSET